MAAAPIGRSAKGGLAAGPSPLGRLPRCAGPPKPYGPPSGGFLGRWPAWSLGAWLAGPDGLACPAR